jgi:hypothetical protein
VAFADIEDLDATRETLLTAGATERDAPRRVAPETRICVLADAEATPSACAESSRQRARATAVLGAGPATARPA